MATPTTLVTGGSGFLGSWLMKRLLDEGHRVRSFDIATNPAASAVLGEACAAVDWRVGDVADASAVAAALEGCDGVVHIAALLTPACRADPIRAVRTNLIGSLNVFEAARKQGLDKVVYASTAAMFGPTDIDVPRPVTHYGSLKLALEGCARAYWHDHGLASVGLRPLVLYGPCRELGPSAGVSLACAAAAAGQAYTIPFSGRSGFMYVEEMTSCFSNALTMPATDARVYNCWGRAADIREVIDAIRTCRPNARISAEGSSLGVPADVDSSGIYEDLPAIERFPLRDGIARTIEFYERGALDTIAWPTLS